MRQFAVVALLAALSAMACDAPAPPPSPRVIRMAMHPLQSGRVGVALTQAIAAAIPDTTLEIQEFERGKDLVAAVQAGESDFAFTYADMTYLAFVGQLGDPPFDRLRGIAVLNTNPIYLIVGAGSAIRDVGDLRGRRVSLGLEGSVTAVTSQIFLTGLHTEVHRSFEPFGDAVTSLGDGGVDAIFAVGSYPLEPLRKAVSAGARVVSLPEGTVDRIRREHPFLRTVVIPAGMYGDQAVLTVGTDRLLICREGLDADLVYQFTKAFFQALPQLSLLDTPLQRMNVEEASATPVPLHPGAAQYYRDQE